MCPLILLICASALPLPAQFWARLGNPSVEVDILHPPDLGLKISRIALAPSRNPMSREFADALAVDLLRSRELEVVDRGNVDLLNRAQEMAASGSVDPALVVQLRAALGPGALLIVNVSRAEFKREESSKENKDRDGKVTSTTHTLTTVLDFDATLQVVDVTSGKVLSAVEIHELPSISTTSDKGKPTPPDERELRLKVFDVARDRVLKLLLPWTEKTKQIFFDDKTYHMDQAAARMDAHDLRGAMELAVLGAGEAEADARGEAKLRARAIYNLGIVSFAQGDPAAAGLNFQRALEILPDAGIFKDALKDAIRAVHIREAYQRYRNSGEPATPPVQGPGVKSPKARTPEERLEDLDRLWKKGLLSEDEYKAKRVEILKEL